MVPYWGFNLQIRFRLHQGESRWHNSLVGKGMTKPSWAGIVPSTFSQLYKTSVCVCLSAPVLSSFQVGFHSYLNGSIQPLSTYWNGRTPPPHFPG